MGEYWLSDPEGRTFEQPLLRDGHCVIVQAGADDDVFKPATFPGLEIPLALLWTMPEDRPTQG